MKQKISILLSLVFVGALIFFVATSSQKNTNTLQNSESDTKVEAVKIVDGKQIIEVTARGGYYPREIKAKANTPTTLRMKTLNTFDCSSAFTIPSLGIQKLLPATGVTEFEIPAQKPGTSVRGVCSMGMYNFVINFE